MTEGGSPWIFPPSGPRDGFFWQLTEPGKYNKIVLYSSRGGEVVSHVAHNHETRVQFPPPQHLSSAGVAQWLERALHKR